MLFEYTTEIERIVVADNIRYFGDIVLWIFKQRLSVIDSDRQNILQRSVAGVFFEITDKPAGTHMMRSSVFINADIFVIVLIKIH